MENAIKITGGAGIRIDMKKAAAALKKAPIVREIANEGRNMVIQRTLAGKDVKLKKFAPYSTKPIYLPINHRPKPKGGVRRKRKGKLAKSVFYEGGYAEFAKATKGSVKVNLNASGRMLGAFQVQKVRKRSATLGFNRREEARKASALSKKRPFVGISSERELRFLEKIAERRINETIKRFGL